MADSTPPADVAPGGGSGAEETRSKKWLPLESNPEVMNDFVRKVGFPPTAGFHDMFGLNANLLAIVPQTFVRKVGFPPTAGFHDVFGLDTDLLAMVPQPVLALLFLFLLPPEERSKEPEQQEKVPEQATPSAEAAQPFFVRQTIDNACGTTIPLPSPTIHPSLFFPTLPSSHQAAQPFFVRQTIDNACGTIALLHAIGNNQHQLTLEKGSFLQQFFENTKDMTPEDGSFLQQFFENTKDMTPEDRAAYLEADTLLEKAHTDAPLRHFNTLPFPPFPYPNLPTSQRAAYLEADTLLEKAHTDAAEAGDTRVGSLHLF
ncbi:unnamed protein product [Closterium sp. Naga37s-1]|nr:unnamed protein product [Closterium sp. Naga37s-1]